jgi:hypothetical protein
MHKCYKKYNWENKKFHMPSWNEYAREECERMIKSAYYCGRTREKCIHWFTLFDYKIVGNRAAKRFGRLRRQGKVKFNPPLYS